MQMAKDMVRERDSFFPAYFPTALDQAHLSVSCDYSSEAQGINYQYLSQNKQ